MSVWEEEAGSRVAQLSIFDPATNTSETRRAHVGDQLDLGTERFDVVQIVSEEGAWVDLSRVTPVARGSSLLRILRVLQRRVLAGRRAADRRER